MRWRINYFQTPLLLSASEPEIAVLSSFRLKYNHVYFELSLILQRNFDAVFVVLTIYWRSKNERRVIALDINAWLVAIRIIRFSRTGLLDNERVAFYNRELAIAYSSVIKRLQPFVDRVYNHAYHLMMNEVIVSRRYSCFAHYLTDPYFACFNVCEELKTGLLRLHLIEHFNLNSVRNIFEESLCNTITRIELRLALNCTNCCSSLATTVPVLEAYFKELYPNYDVRYSRLDVCVLIRHLDLIEEMIRNGAEVNPSAANVVHPFLIAVQMGYDDVCRLLMSRGANVSFLKNTEGRLSREAILINPNLLESNSCIFYTIQNGHNRPFWDLNESIQKRSSEWLNATLNTLVGRCSGPVRPAAAVGNELKPPSVLFTVSVDKLLITMYDNFEVTVHNVGVLSLLHSCRSTILREILQNGVSLDSVDTLEIPLVTKNYLKFK
ncbi:hypothetical protein CHUAL_008463 [Chamberlinius hualienensis]